MGRAVQLLINMDYLFLQSGRKQLRAIGNIKHTILSHRRGINRVIHIDFRQQLHFFARLQNSNVAVFITDVNFAVRVVGRSPDSCKGVVFPVLFASVSIPTINKAANLLCT